MSHIFISYARKDLELATKIVDALAEKEVDSWIDWKSIPKGEYWEQEIYRGIEEADAFVFLISPNSVRSEMCNKEIMHAVENRKRILPILIQPAQLADFFDRHPRREISKRNWINCRKGQDNFNAAIDEVIKTIHTDYEWLKIHTRLQVQALDWKRSNHEKSLLLHGKELKDAERQLAANAPKEPYLTDVQREYILRSREVTDTQRRTVIGIAIGVVFILVMLFANAQTQSGIARDMEITANSNISIAATEGIKALTEESGRATAQANAVENEKIAKENARTRLAHQLAAQAQSLNVSPAHQSVAALLAVQSMKIEPSSGAAQILLYGSFSSHTVARFPHEDEVTSAAFSPDGSYLITGSEDSTARVWDVASGKEMARLTHEGSVNTVAFSPDGKSVVTGSSDGTARVWDPFSGSEVASMTHGDSVSSATFSPDGKTVLSESLDFAYVWDAFSGHEIARKTYNVYASATAFSPDGRYVASAGCDARTGDDLFLTACAQGSLSVWEVATGTEIFRTGSDQPDSFLDFSPDGRYVASGGCATDPNDSSSVCTQGSIRIWDVSTGREFVHMAAESYVSFVAFSPDGRSIVSIGGEVVNIWDAFSGASLARMRHDGTVTEVSFSADGRTVVSGSQDGTARVWDALSGREIGRLIHDQPVTAVGFRPDGKSILSSACDLITRNALNACTRSSVHLWEISADRSIVTMNHDNQVTSVAFSPDGQYLISGSSDRSARVWDLASGKEVSRLSYSRSVTSVAFSPDGRYVASTGCDVTASDLLSGCPQGSARVWEALTGREVARVIYGSDVDSVTFSPDGKYVLSAGCESKPSFLFACTEGRVQVWEVSTGSEVSRKTFGGPVKAAVFSPDGKYVVSSVCVSVSRTLPNICTDGFVLVWEAMTGKEVTRASDLLDQASSVAVSPDGRLVASNSMDNARVWKAFSGDKDLSMFSPDNIAILNHDGAVTSVAFSPDGNYLLSASIDRTARVWDLSTEQELARMSHDGEVTSAVFSPDGKYVASVSGAAVHVWSIGAGSEVALLGHNGAVTSAAFSPDGKYLVTGSADATARRWLWRSDDLIAKTCLSIPRNLSRPEWTQYIGEALPYQAVCPNLPIDP